jgi:3-phenylpropionate/trans-cinnamate dioxygenase ferredoxin reductase subunit
MLPTFQPFAHVTANFQFEARAHRLSRRTSLVDLAPVHLSSLSPRIRLHLAQANVVDTQAKVVTLSNGSEIRYGWLLIACGAVPRRLPLPSNPHVITIRDQQSVLNLASALKSNSAERLRVVLVGGGGIAMELARHPVLQSSDVVWVRFRSEGKALPAPL